MSDHVRLTASAAAGDFPGIIYRAARYSRPRRSGFELLWIVIHCAECVETRSAAEALQSYAATMRDGRQASWNFACDSDSTTQSVLLSRVAFHAPPLNDVAIGIELAGYAKQLTADWADDFSRAMLQGQLIPLLARVSAKTGIPIRNVDDEELKAVLETANEFATGSKSRLKADAEEWLALRRLHGGVLTHAQVSRVFKKSTHTDPGRWFPLQDVVEQAGQLAEALPQTWQ